MSHILRTEQKYKAIKAASRATQGQAKIGVMPTTFTQLFLFFFFLITVIPLFIHNQWFTGTLINAILILSYLLFGLRRALFLTFIPSIAALTTGLLPLVLVPIIPFIVAGNILLILIFHYFEHLNNILKITLAAFLKFVFLYTSTYFITQFFLFDMQYSIVFLLFGWHQFATALMGGLIALSLNTGLSKYEHTR